MHRLSLFTQIVTGHVATRWKSRLSRTLLLWNWQHRHEFKLLISSCRLHHKLKRVIRMLMTTTWNWNHLCLSNDAFPKPFTCDKFQTDYFFITHAEVESRGCKCLCSSPLMYFCEQNTEMYTTFVDLGGGRGGGVTHLWYLGPVLHWVRHNHQAITHWVGDP